MCLAEKQAVSQQNTYVHSNPTSTDRADTSDTPSLQHFFGHACLTLKIRFEIWEVVINGESTWIVLFVPMIAEVQNSTGSRRNWGCRGAIYPAGAPERFELVSEPI